MPTTTPAANHQLGTATPPVTRLVSVTGCGGAGDTPRCRAEIGGRRFLLADLESLDRVRLEQFGRSLRLDASGYCGARRTQASHRARR